MTVTSNLLPNGKQQFLDGNGKPLAGGSVYFYIPSTTTFKTTWQDPDRVSVNTNPVVLDANGEAVIFGDGEYRQIVKDVFGNTIWDALTLQFVTVGGDLSGQLPNPTVNPTVFLSQFSTNKNPPVDNDRFLSLDSANALSPIYFLWSQIKTAMQTALTTIFDARYAQSTNIGLGFSALVINVTSDTQVNITVDKIVAFSASNAAFVGNAINVTGDLSASGANGLDAGVKAVSTWYNVFVIYNPTSNTWAALLSLSASSPTMPSGYTYKVRVGAIRNDAANKLMRSLQKGPRAQWVIGANPTALPLIQLGDTGSLTVPTWTAIAVAPFVPPTARELFYSGGPTSDTAAYDAFMLAPNGNYGNYTSGTNPPPFALPQNLAIGKVQGQVELESANIYLAVEGANVRISALGWVDNL